MKAQHNEEVHKVLQAMREAQRSARRTEKQDMRRWREDPDSKSQPCVGGKKGASMTNPTPEPRWVEFSLPDASVLLCEDFLPQADADALFASLQERDTINWQQRVIRLYGKEYQLPRLTAWYGDTNACYRYSGILNQPLRWTPELLSVRTHVQDVAGHHFNSVLLNLYRSGEDSVSWHADNEPELGKTPVIASLSVGEVRMFQMRHTTRKDVPLFDVSLPHGSLLLMKGDTQNHWQHRISKTRRSIGARINLTFRYIYKSL